MGIKISELPQASQLTSDDIIPIVQSGETKKVSVTNVITNSHNTNQANTYSSDYINNNFNKVNVQTSQTTSTTDTYSCNYIDNKIKNEYNTSTTKGYSSNYINNKIEELTTYSTDEQIVGEFLGKPLYRRVYEGTTSNVASGEVTTSMAIDNVDKVVKWSGWIQGADVPYTLPAPNSRVIKISNTSIRLDFINQGTSTGFARKSYILCVEYTKTTD